MAPDARPGEAANSDGGAGFYAAAAQRAGRAAGGVPALHPGGCQHLRPRAAAALPRGGARPSRGPPLGAFVSQAVGQLTQRLSGQV